MIRIIRSLRPEKLLPGIFQVIGIALQSPISSKVYSKIPFCANGIEKST